MTNKNIFNSLGGIDPKLIEEAAPSEKIQKYKRNGWMKWVAVAAACICLICSAIIIVPILRNDVPENTNQNSDNRYKDFLVQAESGGIVWPWKYKTIYEKYYTIDFNGVQFIGRQRVIPDDYIGEKLGVYTATGYDDITDQIYYEQFETYAIKDVDTDRLIAVEMENQYYVFISESYILPATLGEFLEVYSLTQYVNLGIFSVNEKGKDTTYHIVSDDEYIWNILKECADAEVSDAIGWHENRGDYISFTVTSEVLGVYKNAMYVTENGYVWTNSFNGEYLYFIGENATEKIIKYAMENSTLSEMEPYNKTVTGKIVEITEDYILIDDSILCKDPSDGISFKILLDDLRISRYVDNEVVKVGNTVQIVYEGEITDNSIRNAISASVAIIVEGDILIAE